MDLGLGSGIVIKIFPQKSSVTLLDRDEGIIEAHSDPSSKIKRLCQGAQITYHLQPYRNRYLLNNVDFVAVPFSWARQDILFLHHMLELVIYFLPPKSAHPEVFDLFSVLYSTPVRSSLLFKKKFLIRFFLLLGMYPEDEELLERVLQTLKIPVDDPGDEALHLEAMHVDVWLLSCIRLHPYSQLFKTTHFLTQTAGNHDEHT